MHVLANLRDTSRILRRINHRQNVSMNRSLKLERRSILEAMPVVANEMVTLFNSAPLTLAVALDVTESFCQYCHHRTARPR